MVGASPMFILLAVRHCQLIAGGFLGVSDQEPIAGQTERVPSLALQGFDFTQFAMPVGNGRNQHKFAILREDL
jgi:hypothetical protein